uniref:Uncharacterized protein n=1 Tax=Anguilla anguilla TaxID=7936 RepID=A0A0E9TWR2_ANGAN
MFDHFILHLGLSASKIQILEIQCLGMAVLLQYVPLRKFLCSEWY